MHTTLVTALLLSTLLACSHGGKPTDTYTRSTNLEQQCCEHLTGPGRDSCLGELVRIEDQGVQTSSANQSTYACVTEHFTCDAHTGRATQASAQAQLECIQEL